MKILVSITLSFLMALSAMAQSTVYEEIKKHPEYTASNNVAYPGPKQAQLTPAPKGKQPFYISHYGRHGSRYLTKTRDYEYVVEVLTKAQKENKLSALGKDVLKRALILQQDAENRWGDLTPLGAQQNKDIAARMMKNFPKVFEGNTHVDARSTLVPRCLLSMSNALLQMNSENPELNITLNASPHDLYYMNHQDRHLDKEIKASDAEKIYMEYAYQHQKWDRMLNSLFNDTAYVRKHIDAYDMNYYMFRLAGSIQNTELRNEITLYDIYKPEEIANNWRQSNVWWYLRFGPTTLNGGHQIFTQRNLLRKLIQDADSCITLSENNVQLRFGHDTMVMPLVCLMNINGFKICTTDLESIVEKGWIDFRIFPMACNLQMIFYRSNLSDKDILVKVLFNENEAKLPVKTDMAPYYHWKDVRDHYLKVLDTYIEPKE